MFFLSDEKHCTVDLSNKDYLGRTTRFFGDSSIFNERRPILYKLLMTPLLIV